MHNTIPRSRGHKKTLHRNSIPYWPVNLAVTLMGATVGTLELLRMALHPKHIGFIDLKGSALKKPLSQVPASNGQKESYTPAVAVTSKVDFDQRG